MREIGGYLGFERYSSSRLHEGAVALNCGRNALAYLIRARGIRHIYLPQFLCETVGEVCWRAQISVTYYPITEDFLPAALTLADGAWLYVVNYYGQIGNERLAALARKYGRVIVDNAQAYFQEPVAGVDTLYTCRKFFGVPDGAFLYTDARLNEPLERDESFERMRHILGRFERSASEFYQDSVANDRLLIGAPLKAMSRLTENLLRGIDYAAVKARRTRNFRVLHESLGARNALRLNVPEGAFMYPFYVADGARVRREMQRRKIYVPTLWPNVLELPDSLERRYAENILPLPCDQRYDEEDMRAMLAVLEELLDAREGC